MRKQLIVLMGATLLVAGASGMALPVLSAYAAETGTAAAVSLSDTQSDTSSTTSDYSTLLLNDWLSKLDIHTEALSSRNSGDFADALASGAILTAASQLEASDLIGKLNALFSEDMASEVQSGSLTAQEAAALAQTANERIAGLVNSGWSAGSHTVVIQTNASAIIHSRLRTIADDASLPSGVGSIDLRRALRDGESLVEATGMDRSALNDALTALLNQDLEAAVKEGTLPADQLEKAEKDGASALWDAANTEGYDPETTLWMEQYGQRLLADRLDPISIIQYAAAIGGKDIGDVQSNLSDGQNLSTATGMAESDLTSQLTDNVNQVLENEWKAGNLTVKLLTKLEQHAGDVLQKAVEQSGYGTQAAAGTSSSALAAESIRSIVADSAGYAGMSVSDLHDKLATGQTLVGATAVDQAELTSALQPRIDAFLNAAVQKGWLAKDNEQATKDEAYVLLNDAVTTANYKATIDAKQYLVDRLNRIVDDAVEVTDTKSDEVLKSLASGRSLQQALGVDTDSLLLKLLRKADKEINGFVTYGELSENEATALKNDYASAVTKIIANN
ncbi:hypothetical protein [Paenibacillus planticolens]|uniref:Uncharacterized protein n=1 Tax=Paenibacillus planticolens TaxID=2654976 RepID=A0ABX1ZF96_9BACL|nr:hypothetical protein [Paenibacillus planticolens]NOU98768.1 hypothetical protein [Paenibacillus planticolens]